MNVLADESIDRPIVDRLRQDGRDVTYVAELAPSISDDKVLRQANSLSAVLLTADKDFGELVYRQGRADAVIGYFRCVLKAEIVAETFRDRVSQMSGAFTVISAGIVRIRRHP